MASKPVASLAVRIGADTTELKRGVASAGSSLTKLGKIGVDVGLRIVGAMAAATAGIVALANKGIQLGDQLSKTAAKLGTTTEQLNGLRFAAEQTGVASSTLDMAMQRMTRRLSEAANGTGVAAKALKELGLDAKELQKLPLQEQFNRISDAMQGVENQSDRVRLAFKLFDSEGVALVNTLNAGRDALNDLYEENKRYGNYLDQTQSRVVQEATDAQGRLKTAMSGLALQLGATLAPAFEVVYNAIAKFAGFVTTSLLPRFVAIIERITGIKRAVEDLADTELDLRTQETQRSLDDVNSELQETARRIDEYAQQYRRFIDGPLKDTRLAGQFAMQHADAIRRQNELLEEQSKLHRELVEIEAARKNRADESVVESAAEADAATRDYIQTLLDAIETENASWEAWDTVSNTFAKIEEEKTRKLAEEAAKRDEERKNETQRMISNLLIELDEIERIEEMKRHARLRTAESALDSLASMTAGVAQHNKKMFALNKLAAVGNAVMNTAQGVTKALAEYPPPLSFAMAAAQAAAGLAQVQAIKTTTFNGNGGGTTPSAAGSTPTVNSQPTQVIHIKGVSPDSLFTGRQVVDLFNEAVKDGAKVVFN